MDTKYGEKCYKGVKTVSFVIKCWRYYNRGNSSRNAYENNYEKIRIVRSWVDSEKESVEDEQQEFDRLWDGTNDFVDVYKYSDAVKKIL